MRTLFLVTLATLACMHVSYGSHGLSYAAHLDALSPSKKKSFLLAKEYQNSLYTELSKLSPPETEQYWATNFSDLEKFDRSFFNMVTEAYLGNIVARCQLITMMRSISSRARLYQADITEKKLQEMIRLQLKSKAFLYFPDMEINHYLALLSEINLLPTLDMKKILFLSPRKKLITCLMQTLVLHNLTYNTTYNLFSAPSAEAKTVKMCIENIKQHKKERLF